MKFDDVIESLPPEPHTADDILNGMLAIVNGADDLTANDKAGFATGFLMGITYTLAKSNEGNVPDAARTLLRLHNEWEASGLL